MRQIEKLISQLPGHSTPPALEESAAVGVIVEVLTDRSDSKVPAYLNNKGAEIFRLTDEIRRETIRFNTREVWGRVKICRVRLHGTNEIVDAELDEASMQFWKGWINKLKQLKSKIEARIGSWITGHYESPLVHKRVKLSRTQGGGYIITGLLDANDNAVYSWLTDETNVWSLKE